MTQEPFLGVFPMWQDGVQVTVQLAFFREDGKSPILDSRLEKPWRFRLGDGTMIDGVDANVRKMRVGQTLTSRLPASLAWGSRGVDGLIAPDEALMVKISLLEARDS
jgi:FKBP-type peptidyl-prolyl cis-trans isomerase